MWSQLLAEDRIASAEELRSLVGVPHETVVKKTIAQVDSHVAAYLARSPLFFLSTANAAGRGDVSPRGDEPGFVKVLDDRHIIYPERMGNRRVDSLLNMLENPQVGMVFLIPGMEEVVRINGVATITKKAGLLAQQGWTGKTLNLGVVVKVEECFVHCPRALKHAGVWKTETWPSPESRIAQPSIRRGYIEAGFIRIREGPETDGGHHRRSLGRAIMAGGRAHLLRGISRVREKKPVDSPQYVPEAARQFASSQAGRSACRDGDHGQSVQSSRADSRLLRGTQRAAGKGVGSTFLQHLIRWAKQEGQYALLIIEVEAEDTPANANRTHFRAKMGFQTTSYVHYYIWVPEPYRAMYLQLVPGQFSTEGEHLFSYLTRFHKESFAESKQGGRGTKA